MNGIFPSGRNDGSVAPYFIDSDENPNWTYMKGIGTISWRIGKIMLARNLSPILGLLNCRARETAGCEIYI